MGKENQVRYRDLIENIQEVFFLCELIYDQTGKPVDFKYLDANPACLSRAGRSLQEMLGHTYLELFPKNPTFETWLARFARVDLSQSADGFEQFAEATGLYFYVTAYSFHPGQVAVLMNDITGLKLAEKQIGQLTRLNLTLRQVNQAISRYKNRDEMFQSICDIVVNYGKFSLAWVGLLDEQTGNINPVAVNGLDIKNWPFHTVNIRHGDMRDSLTSIAFRTARIITNEDIQSSPQTAYLGDQIRNFDYRSSASIPLRSKEKIIGVLNLVSNEGGVFKAKEEMALLEELAQEISFALDTIQVEYERNEAEKLQFLWVTAFQNFAHGIDIVLPDSDTILTCNPAFARLQGRTVEEITGMPYIEMYIPEDRPRVLQLIAEADRTGRVNYETQMIRKDGSTYPVQMDVVSVRDNSGKLLYRVVTQQDISERKKTEEALRKSERMYRLLTENIQDVIWVLDTDSMCFTYVSPSVLTLRGYTPPEVMAVPVDEALMPEDRAKRREVIRQVAEDILAGEKSPGEYAINEVEQPCKDGSTVWTEVTTHYYVNPENGKVEVVGVTRDISARRKAEIALKESEAILRLFIDHAPAALAMFDCNMIYQAASQRWVTDYHLTGKQILGKSHYDVFPEITEDLKAIHRRGMAGEVIRSGEEKFIRLDGSIQWLKWEVHPWFRDDKSVGGIIIFSEDVTEEKLAGEKIETLVERFELAARAAHLGIWDWDMVESRSVWDDYVYTLYGIKKEDAPDTFEIWKNSMHPDDRARSEETILQATSTNKDYDTEFRILWPDGSLHWLKAYGQIIRDAEGKPRRMIGVNYDITKQKIGEEEIRKLNSELEQRVKERTSQLESANRELEAFAYSVSHDLRAPLRGIDGWSLALMEDYNDLLDEKGRQYLKIVRSETQRMGHIIDDLLRLSRLTRTEMQTGPVNLSGLAQEVFSRLQEAEPDRQVELIIQPDLVTHGDVHLLEIALTNLLSNAFKFTGKQPQARIEFGQTQIDGKRVYFIRDNGVGFNMEHAKNLFGVFQRIHKSTEFPGTGIGLATVQRIIQRHNGNIWAEAENDVGATFYFTLEESI